MMYAWWVYPIIIGAAVILGTTITLLVGLVMAKYIFEPFAEWLYKE